MADKTKQNKTEQSILPLPLHIYMSAHLLVH